MGYRRAGKETLGVREAAHGRLSLAIVGFRLRLVHRSAMVDNRLFFPNATLRSTFWPTQPLSQVLSMVKTRVTVGR